ncbi:MAG: nucleotidyltransferase family protein [Bacteroidia bacterium]|nr:nucleotidyltransferase family protein [Bacteroidia bacterium]
MTKEAIVLAGGMGTRLRTVVSDVPKPMAPVNGRPFLAYVLDDLCEQGIERVILAVGYKREVIIDTFGINYRGMELRYSIEEEALGTGGGIKQAFDLVAGERAYVLNGDTYFRVNLGEMDSFFDENQCDMALALKPMTNFDRYGTVKIDEESCRVLGFEEKQQRDAGLINGGVYLFGKSLWNGLNLGEKFSFEKEILEGLFASHALCGMVSDTYFIDIGIPSDYEQSQHDFAALRA